MSSVALPIPSEADQKVADKVRYAAGASAVKLGQNVAYEETNYKYEDEAVYEVPTWSADMLYALYDWVYMSQTLIYFVVSYCI